MHHLRTRKSDCCAPQLKSRSFSDEGSNTRTPVPLRPPTSSGPKGQDDEVSEGARPWAVWPSTEQSSWWEVYRGARVRVGSGRHAGLIGVAVDVGRDRVKLELPQESHFKVLWIDSHEVELTALRPAMPVRCEAVAPKSTIGNDSPSGCGSNSSSPRVFDFSPSRRFSWCAIGGETPRSAGVSHVRCSSAASLLSRASSIPSTGTAESFALSRASSVASKLVAGADCLFAHDLADEPTEVVEEEPQRLVPGTPMAFSARNVPVADGPGSSSARAETAEAGLSRLPPQLPRRNRERERDSCTEQDGDPSHRDQSYRLRRQRSKRWKTNGMNRTVPDHDLADGVNGRLAVGGRRLAGIQSLDLSRRTSSRARSMSSLSTRPSSFGSSGSVLDSLHGSATSLKEVAPQRDASTSGQRSAADDDQGMFPAVDPLKEATTWSAGQAITSVDLPRPGSLSLPVLGPKKLGARPRPPQLKLAMDEVDTEASAGGLTNASRVLENLWLGGQEAAGDKSSLLREGVSHIVNCTRRLINLYPDDFHYHRVNWADDTGQDMRPVVLQTAFRHIDAARQSGRACLVHCQAGSSRSCSLVIGYLMQLDQGMSLLAALEFCQAKRPQCNPDKYFLEKLSEYEESLFGQTSVSLRDYNRGDTAGSLAIGARLP